jgi:hypothetical protein
MSAFDGRVDTPKKEHVQAFRRRRKSPNPNIPTPRSARVDGSGTCEMGVAKKPRSGVEPGLFSKVPTICPASLMPLASVTFAPGTSIWVKLPPVSRKP